MKAVTADAIRRLIADPAATEGEREAARTKLAEAGVPIDPPRPPAPPAGGPAPFEPWRWSHTGASTNGTFGSVWVRFTVRSDL